MTRRIVSLWFPRLISERRLRRADFEGAFAITAQINGANRIICLNDAAQKQGVKHGMGVADARSFCPHLKTEPHVPQEDQAFLGRLLRWAKRYCPWVGTDGSDGLLLDVTGSTHLRGGEAALLEDIGLRLARARLTVRLGLADTPGAAWALARFAQGRAKPGQTLEAMRNLPIASLRISAKDDSSLQRLGLKTVGQLAALPRATIGQRFGASVLMRLDQALGDRPESISPQISPPTYTTLLNLPEPIGLAQDMMAGIERLLVPLCEKLSQNMSGARILSLTCRRADGGDQTVELRLARALRDPARILPLFEKGVREINAGFGIDQLRLSALQVETLPPEQTTHDQVRQADGLQDLMTRLGNRIGLENIQRFLPAESHIPERSFLIAPAAWSEPSGAWVSLSERPLRLCLPEHVAATSPTPPKRFKWRGMSLRIGQMTGPERIAPEWWLDDENWRHGLRDYWKIETLEGPRLWMFHTPQNPNWFVHGIFA